MAKKLHLIRGARIVQQLESQTLTEAPYAELERRTMTFTPQTVKRQYAIDEIRVTKMELIPAQESSNLTARSEVTSEGNKYQSTLMFDGVEFDTEDTATNVSFKAVDGEEYNIMPVSLTRTNCKVSCTCLDFYWRFAAQNAKADSLNGQPPPPYQKKTNRPPVNPANVPGVCKHIMKTVVALRDAGLVTN